MKGEHDLLKEISEKLDRILALMAVRDLDDSAEKVRILNEMGMDNATIAIVTGLSKNAVAVRLSRMRGRPK